MKRGALLFAFNSENCDYYHMAEFTAKRINHFLNLPVTLVTNEESLPEYPKFNFDSIILEEPNTSNKRDKKIWQNKDRYKAYHFSPYDETLLLDVDFLINSNKLTQVFSIYDDFMCHGSTSFFMFPNLNQEYLSKNSFQLLWATAIAFKKTTKTKHIFECIEMIQNNFEHYANIHGFLGGVYRNDYALTLALRIANGHKISNKELIPWNLWHVSKDVIVYPNTNNEFNTEYTMTVDETKNGRTRKNYIVIKDFDFHMMSKDNFSEIVNG